MRNRKSYIKNPLLRVCRLAQVAFIVVKMATTLTYGGQYAPSQHSETLQEQEKRYAEAYSQLEHIKKKEKKEEEERQKDLEEKELGSRFSDSEYEKIQESYDRHYNRYGKLAEKLAADKSKSPEEIAKYASMNYCLPPTEIKGVVEELRMGEKDRVCFESFCNNKAVELVISEYSLKDMKKDEKVSLAFGRFLREQQNSNQVSIEEIKMNRQGLDKSGENNAENKRRKEILDKAQEMREKTKNELKKCQAKYDSKLREQKQQVEKKREQNAKKHNAY